MRPQASGPEALPLNPWSVKPMLCIGDNDGTYLLHEIVTNSDRSGGWPERSGDNKGVLYRNGKVLKSGKIFAMYCSILGDKVSCVCPRDDVVIDRIFWKMQVFTCHH